MLPQPSRPLRRGLSAARISSTTWRSRRKDGVTKAGVLSAVLSAFEGTAAQERVVFPVSRVPLSKTTGAFPSASRIRGVIFPRRMNRYYPMRGEFTRKMNLKNTKKRALSNKIARLIFLSAPRKLFGPPPFYSACVCCRPGFAGTIFTGAGGSESGLCGCFPIWSSR